MMTRPVDSINGVELDKKENTSVFVENQGQINIDNGNGSIQVVNQPHTGNHSPTPVPAPLAEAYVHPALIPKGPLQRRATAPTRQSHPHGAIKEGVPNQNHVLPNKKLERIATVQHRYKRKIGPYTLTKTLGAGSMGKVKLGVHEKTGEKVAVKIIHRKPHPINTSADEDKALTDMEHEDKRVMREVSILFLLHHPFIVKMIDFMVTPHHYYLMSEYVEGGQLLDYIIAHGKLNERTARKFARQILSSLDYCHKNSVVHRDLKIENILISNTGSIKIIDFGLSNLYSSKSHLNTFCGSLYFAAPELLSAKAYVGPEVDIWSFGIVLYVLMCGEVPFDDKSMTMIHHKIKRGIVKYPAWLSPDCRHLLSRLLVTNPAERATMNELMQHPWINKGFHGPPDSYFPLRVIPEPALDMEAIKQMTGFQFGNPTTILKLVEKSINEYKLELQKRSNGNQSKGIQTPISFPYLSIYHLAVEKLKREANKEKEKESEIEKGNALTEMSDKKVDQHLVVGESSLSRSKSCRPNINGVSGRYSAIKGSNLKEVVNVSTHNTQLSTQNNSLLTSNSNHYETVPTSLSRRNSERRVSAGPINIPNKIANNGTNEINERKPSIRFQEKPLLRVTSTKSVKNQPMKSFEEDEERDQMANLMEVVNKEKENPINKQPQRKPSKLDKITNFLTRGTSLREAKTPSPSAKPDILSPLSSAGQDSKLTSSIPHVYLKGLFSVATTSTKKPEAIRLEIIRVLQELKWSYSENEGYITVVGNKVNNNFKSPENRQLSPSRNINGSERIVNGVKSENDVNKPTIDNFTSQSELGSSVEFSQGKDDRLLQVPLSQGINSTTTSTTQPSPLLSASSSSSKPTKQRISNTHASQLKEKLEVRFEIQIVKVSLLRLHGIKFRRLVGHSWEYKQMCQKLVEKLRI